MAITQMSGSFHDFIRHTIECHSRDGQLQAELLAIREKLLEEIPPGEWHVGESEVSLQRRCELAYLDGYLQGPAPEVIDRASVVEGVEQREAPKIPKYSPRRQTREDLDKFYGE